MYSVYSLNKKDANNNFENKYDLFNLSFIKFLDFIKMWKGFNNI